MRDQCQAANVAYFFKQWGEWLPSDNFIGERLYETAYKVGWSDNFSQAYVRVGKKAAGRLLDGKEWSMAPGETYA